MATECIAKYEFDDVKVEIEYRDPTMPKHFKKIFKQDTWKQLSKLVEKYNYFNLTFDMLIIWDGRNKCYSIILWVLTPTYLPSVRDKFVEILGIDESKVVFMLDEV